MKNKAERKGKVARCIPWLLVASALLVAGCSHTGPVSLPAYEVVSFTGCKDLLEGTDARGAHVTESCVRYEYDGTGVLTLTHVDGAFNCGAWSVGGDVKFYPGGLIQIDEWEDVPTPADCICLFDIDYRLTGVSPGIYRLIIVEPYLNPGNEQFDVVLNLFGEVSGEYCVPRTGYPWNHGARAGG